MSEQFTKIAMDVQVGEWIKPQGDDRYYQITRVVRYGSKVRFSMDRRFDFETFTGSLVVVGQVLEVSAYQVEPGHQVKWDGMKTYEVATYTRLQGEDVDLMTENGRYGEFFDLDRMTILV